MKRFFLLAALLMGVMSTAQAASQVTVTFGFHNRLDSHPEGAILAACAGTTGLKNPLNDGTELVDPITGQLNVSKGDLRETWTFNTCPMSSVIVSDIYDVRGGIVLILKDADNNTLARLTDVGDYYIASEHDPYRPVKKIIGRSVTVPPPGSKNAGGHIQIACFPDEIYEVELGHGGSGEVAKTVTHCDSDDFSARFFNEDGDDITGGVNCEWKVSGTEWGDAGSDFEKLVGRNPAGSHNVKIEHSGVLSKSQCRPTAKQLQNLVLHIDAECVGSGVDSSYPYYAYLVSKGNLTEENSRIRNDVLQRNRILGQITELIDVQTVGASSDPTPVEVSARTDYNLTATISGTCDRFGQYVTTYFTSGNSIVGGRIRTNTGPHNPAASHIDAFVGFIKRDIVPRANKITQVHFYNDVTTYVSIWDVEGFDIYDSGFKAWCDKGRVTGNGIAARMRSTVTRIPVDTN